MAHLPDSMLDFLCLLWQDGAAGALLHSPPLGGPSGFSEDVMPWEQLLAATGNFWSRRWLDFNHQSVVVW